MEDLSKKQRGFVKDYIETGNATQSALNNYDTDDYSTAGNIGSDNLRKPKIVDALAEALNDEILQLKHLQLLNKTDEKGVIDTQAVKAGLDMAYKIRGKYAPEKREVTLDIVEPSEKVKKLAEILNNNELHNRGNNPSTGTLSDRLDR